ncbi:hypothetical protein [Cohnella hongkongensis]|uniref:ABC transporter permease n=1 Tax=Cohnella hongkongensis TaxID=178337 RepID=A0ABV9F8W4_9BACL
MSVHRIFKLTRCLLRINTGFVRRPQASRGGTIRQRTAMLFAVGLLCGGSLIYSYVRMLHRAYASFLDMGIPAGFPIVFMGAFQLLLLFAGTFFIVHLFCYSGDDVELLHMPIEPGVLLTSKLLVAILYGYLLELLLLAPVFILYGAHHFSAGFAVTAAAALLAVPMISLVLLAAVAMISLKVAQRYTRVHPGLLGLAGCLLLVAGAAWKAGGVFRADAFGGLLERLNAFNGYHWSLASALLVGLSGTGLLLYGLAGRRLFRSGLILPRGAGSGNASAALATSAIRFHGRASPFVSCFVKEWRLFFREPVFVINGVFGILLPPLLLPLAFRQGTVDGGASMTFREGMEKEPFLTTIAALGVIVTTSAIHAAASSSVSREGRHFWICRMIPVPWETQLLAKLVFAFTLSCCGLVTNCLIFLLHFGYRPSQIVIIFTIGASFCWLWSVIGVLIDASRPKLDWVNKSEAVKQNLNVVLAMLVSLSLIALHGMLLVLALERGWSESGIWISLAAVPVVLSAALCFRLIAMCRRQERDG